MGALFQTGPYRRRHATKTLKSYILISTVWQLCTGDSRSNHLGVLEQFMLLQALVNLAYLKFSSVADIDYYM
jgi:hypothetical protein